MAADIVLKRKDADKLLRDNRRRIVTSETEVAIAKLVYESRADEYWTAVQSRLAFESAHPWLIDETIPVPDELRDTGESGQLQPQYLGIQMRWRGICDRCDRISDQLQSAPAVIQNAMNKQAEFEIKNGQMMSAAEAFAAMIEISGKAASYIETERGRDLFLTDVARIRRELLDANPHLSVKTSGY